MCPFTSLRRNSSTNILTPMDMAMMGLAHYSVPCEIAEVQEWTKRLLRMVSINWCSITLPPSASESKSIRCAQQLPQTRSLTTRIWQRFRNGSGTQISRQRGCMISATPDRKTARHSRFPIDRPCSCRCKVGGIGFRPSTPRSEWRQGLDAIQWKIEKRNATPLLFLVPQKFRQRVVSRLFQQIVQFQVGAPPFGEVLTVGFPKRSDTCVAVFCARLAVVITAAIVETWLFSHLLSSFPFSYLSEH